MAVTGTARRRAAEDRGSVMPALVLLMATLIGGGLLLFQVGRGAILSAEATTAADAAALAAAAELQRQILRMDLAPVDLGAVRAAAADYASRNGGVLVSFERVDFTDVRVVVRSMSFAQQQGRPDADDPRRAESRARARIGFAAGAAGLLGGNGVPNGHLNGNIRDAIALGQSMGLVLTSYYRPGDSDSLHSLGIAADLAGPPAAMAAFYRACLARYSYIEELFYDPIGGIDKNIPIGPIGDHSDHVHVALIGNEVGALPEGVGPIVGGGDGGAQVFAPVKLVPWDG